jgi:hypothetical protein
MKSWLKALFAETAFTTWWIFSGLSTLSTFFVQSLSGKWRFASGISTLVGFAWANFRVFTKQERQISALTVALAAPGAAAARASRLRVAVDRWLRYILVPANNVPRSDFNGMYAEFRLMIENTGPRNSTVDTYAVDVVELTKDFTGLRPEEGRATIQGRHCQYGLNRATGLSGTGIVRIDAESSTNHGTLLFFLRGVKLEDFANAGLHMQGEQRGFSALHCRLTVTDTTLSTTTEEFQMDEA